MLCAGAFPGAYARQAPGAGAAGLVGKAGLLLTLLVFGVVVPAGDLFALPRLAEVGEGGADSAAGGEAGAGGLPAAFLALLALGALAALVGARRRGRVRRRHAPRPRAPAGRLLAAGGRRGREPRA